MDRNIGKLDRTSFATAHSGSVYVQPIFPHLTPADIQGDTFAYPPCWAILDPGMTVEKHRHPIPEFDVFVQGSGQMTLGTEILEVAAGTGVNIPPNVDHLVTNPKAAVDPLIWVSIGLIESSPSGGASRP